MKQENKQPAYYFPVHIHASTLCKLFTSKPYTSNVLEMDELFPCKKKLNKLRLFILEKNSIGGKKKKKHGGLQSYEWPREQFRDSLLLSIQKVRAIMGG